MKWIIIIIHVEREDIAPDFDLFRRICLIFPSLVCAWEKTIQGRSPTDKEVWGKESKSIGNQMLRDKKKKDLSLTLRSSC